MNYEDLLSISKQRANDLGVKYRELNSNEVQSLLKENKKEEVKSAPVSKVAKKNRFSTDW